MGVILDVFLRSQNVVLSKELPPNKAPGLHGVPTYTVILGYAGGRPGGHLREKFLDTGTFKKKTSKIMTTKIDARIEF